MDAPVSSSRQIAWPSVITVISAAILIGAEVFGGAFAGGWALAILFGLDDTGAHVGTDPVVVDPAEPEPSSDVHSTGGYETASAAHPDSLAVPADPAEHDPGTTLIH